MAKIIVTHINPDLDALCAVWLWLRFDKDFSDTQVKLVPAGETLDNQPVDSNPDIVHVDTGLGRFDHHQTDAGNICAASLVFNYLKSKIKSVHKVKALVQLIKVVNEIDHFGECDWPEPTAGRYCLIIEEVFKGLKLQANLSQEEFLDFGLKALDGVFQTFLMKIKAEEEINKKGAAFKLKEGKALALETGNDMVIAFGLKTGFILVVRKDPKSGRIRIKVQPKSKIDLTQVYQQVKEKDIQASWFLHPGKKMLLNGSGKNPSQVPSKLSLEEIVEIIKKYTN